jgi:hypothetical protein
LGFTAQVGIEEGLARYIAWARTFAQRDQATVDDMEVVNWRLEAVGG